jgi:hypothetical protein
LDASTNLPAWEKSVPVMSTFMEQRRTRRFSLQLPLFIRSAGREQIPFTGLTKNISSSGVLFTAQQEPELGSPIEYVVTLNANGPQPVNLRCVGKVLRSELVVTSENAAYQIAATLERYEFVRSV